MDYLDLKRDLHEIAGAIAVAFGWTPRPSRDPHDALFGVVRTWRPRDWARPAEAVDDHLRHQVSHGPGLSVWDDGCNFGVVLDTGRFALWCRADELEAKTTLKPIVVTLADFDRLHEADDLCQGKLFDLIQRGGCADVTLSLTAAAV